MLTAATYFDLHLHTRRHSPDSDLDPLALVRVARQRGLAGVVITEHDWLWTPDELDELRAAAGDLAIFAGIEVSAHDGHFLCYGVRDPFRLPAGIRVADLCVEVHRQGGAVVAAHPYRWGQDFDAILAEARPELDGLEMMSKNMDDDLRARAIQLRQRHADRRWAALGNSDAHDEAMVGHCVTEFPKPIRDERDLIAALRSAATRPVARHREA